MTRGAEMTRQTDAPVDHQTLNATNRPVTFFIQFAADGQIDLSPAYQRGRVWTTDQRIALVYSWLSGVPIPAVILNDRTYAGWRRNGDTTAYAYAVIDGKQRIETAIAWVSGDFAVPASWFDPEFVETTEQTEDGLYVRFTGLTEIGRRFAMRHASLPCAEGRLDSIAAEARVYQLVNGGGTPQTAADMNNAARVARGE
jgi:hypothetical protein